VLPFNIYIAQALLLVTVVVCSYLSHRYYSFRTGRQRDTLSASLYDPAPKD